MILGLGEHQGQSLIREVHLVPDQSVVALVVALGVGDLAVLLLLHVVVGEDGAVGLLHLRAVVAEDLEIREDLVVVVVGVVEVGEELVGQAVEEAVVVVILVIPLALHLPCLQT